MACKNLWLFIFLISSPAFGQECDSTLRALGSAVVSVTHENDLLRQEIQAQSRRYDDMIRAHAEKDSLKESAFKQRIADEMWYSSEMKKSNPLFFIGGAMIGVFLTLTLTILIHLH